LEESNFGCCQEVEAKLENYTLKETFFLFELGGEDLILGVAWLTTLGDVKVNWKTLTMNFCIEGQNVQIRGDYKLTRTLVTPKVLKQEKGIEVVSLIWGTESVDKRSADPSASEKEIAGLSLRQTTELDEVLKECEEVFEETKQLPPIGEIDHKIPIKSGVDPVNVRPYRYLHLLKMEIEKQVAEMLKLGIIRPSNNPYSSPVILVKKKDGSWRFCGQGFE